MPSAADRRKDTGEAFEIGGHAVVPVKQRGIGGGVAQGLVECAFGFDGLAQMQEDSLLFPALREGERLALPALLLIEGTLLPEVGEEHVLPDMPEGIRLHPVQVGNRPEIPGVHEPIHRAFLIDTAVVVIKGTAQIACENVARCSFAAEGFSDIL